MNTILKIDLPKSEVPRLKRVALAYGLTINEMFTHIAKNIKLGVSTESMNDYYRPVAVRSSLKRALSDYTHGRVFSKLE